jgi:hypothetical protein
MGVDAASKGSLELAVFGLVSDRLLFGRDVRVKVVTSACGSDTGWQTHGQIALFSE